MFQAEVAKLFIPLERLLTPLFEKKKEKEKRIAARTLWAAVHGLCFLEETGRVPLEDSTNAAGNKSDYLIENFVRGLSSGSNK